MNNISRDIDSNLDKFKPPYRFKCIQCGKCCSDKNTIVNLTYIDIMRIQWDKNLTLDKLLDIVGFYVFNEPLTDEQKEKMVLPPIHTQNGLAFLGLRKRGDGRCIFLNKNNKCKIYKARPNICRTFPFHFHLNQHKDVSMAYTTKSIEYCPGILEPAPKIDTKKWMSIGRETLENIFKDAILINRWNEAAKSEKIIPIAENYIKIIINHSEPAKKISKNSKKSNISYQQRIKQKIDQQNIKK